MNNALTPLQAFYTMREFLERYFQKTVSDDLGALLSCMQFLEDGQTADPVLWEDWESILKNKQEITQLQLFTAMKVFLNRYYKNTTSHTIKKLLQNIDDIIAHNFDVSPENF